MVRSDNGGGKGKMSAAQKRRLKKKKAAAKRKAEAEAAASQAQGTAAVEEAKGSDESAAAAPALDVTIEYVHEDPLAAEAVDEGFKEQFAAIFEKFASPEELTGQAEEDKDKAEADKAEDTAAADEDEDEDEEDEEEAGLSRKARKKRSRLTVAQLKNLVARPDVVESHDVASIDPRLLIHLKGYRGSVPVPRHWSAKRRYLQGKRGIEKSPFVLPEFIQQTGIDKIRSAIQELDAKKSSKQLARDRTAPKMGKVNIDYQVLHDAFFKYQTKPPMTVHGDIYYEGKEFEAKFDDKKPGVLSDALKEALGMAEGAPPPWLINMQRYGPPPSYPNLQIPGLNAPIPAGQSYGYHPGGWGRPPVDEQGQPLYGDPFGTNTEAETETIDKSHWGAMVVEEEESDESSADEDDVDEDEDEEMATDTGLETPIEDGMTTVTTDLGTPATIELRKGVRRGLDTPDTPAQALYQVVEMQGTTVGDSSLMGSSHQYVVPGAGAGAGSGMAGTDSTMTATTQIDDQSKTANPDDEQRRHKRKLERTSTRQAKKREFKF